MEACRRQIQIHKLPPLTVKGQVPRNITNVERLTHTLSKITIRTTTTTTSSSPTMVPHMGRITYQFPAPYRPSRLHLLTPGLTRES